MDMSEWPTVRLLTTAARLNENRENGRLRLSGITQAGVVTLKALRAHKPLTQVKLARLVHVQTQTIGKIIDRLESHGALVERARDDADRRVWRVGLTTAGRKVLREIEHSEASEHIPNGLTNPALRAALINIVRLAESNACSPAPKTNRRGTREPLSSPVRR
ncbi:MarR family transcriptional regulator [Arthrobacter sp. 260]|nr:MarR family transcriptional regulator [Arthrobacter sp. 260]